MPIPAAAQARRHHNDGPPAQSPHRACRRPASRRQAAKTARRTRRTGRCSSARNLEAAATVPAAAEPEPAAARYPAFACGPCPYVVTAEASGRTGPCAANSPARRAAPNAATSSCGYAARSVALAAGHFARGDGACGHGRRPHRTHAYLGGIPHRHRPGAPRDARRAGWRRAAQRRPMVTSARPSEGKSFTALNLAGSIVQHSTDKVLLVDLDAKLHPLSFMLGQNDRLGFPRSGRPIRRCGQRTSS